jgi:phenylacetic acid degradation operon negative regulatory protein
LESESSARRVRRSSLDAFTPRSVADKLGVLQPQEVILGLFGEYVKPGDKVWSGGLVQLLQDLQFSAAASRIALNRVVARKLLEPIREGKFVFYTISPRLEHVHEEGRRQTFSIAADAPWDGYWTVVWYSLPEKLRFKRGRFSRWLGFRGFGSLQDGTWIAPGDRENDVVSLARELGLEEYVITFISRLSKSRAPRAIVDQIWHLDALRSAYDVLAREFSAYGDARARSKLTPREAFIVRTRAIEMFRGTVSQDPRLPDSVLGIPWKRAETIKSFNILQRTLAPAAESYFRAQAMPETVRRK